MGFTDDSDDVVERLRATAWGTRGNDPAGSPPEARASDEGTRPVSDTASQPGSDSRTAAAAPPEDADVSRTHEPAAPAASELLGRLDDLAAQVADLRRLFETRILRAESEGQINAKLHAELQDHKKGLYSQLVRPVLKDVVDVREHLLKVVAIQDRKPADEQAVSLSTFSDFAADLAQVLEEHGVELVGSQVGDPVDPRLQQVLGKVDTQDPEANRTLASVVGDAYVYEGQVIARQKVTVYMHTAATTGEAP